jgi:biopolymer transport protein ExbD
MQVRRRDQQLVEMQMGPMIDMVFLLLVFFMVTAKPVKQESDISLGLPGTVSAEETVELPDEQRIRIEDDGSVVLNDSVIGPPADTALTGLVATLKRFKESADANKADALVTLDASDSASEEEM